MTSPRAVHTSVGPLVLSYEQGGYLIIGNHLAPGAYQLEAIGDGGQRATGTIEVEEVGGAQETLEFVLRP